MSKRTSEALTFSSQLSTVVDSHLIKEGVFSPFCSIQKVYKKDRMCVRCVQSCLFSVWAHCRCSVFSGCMWRRVCVCVCWGWGGAPECHLFSVMWPSSDTVNHRTGGTRGTHTQMATALVPALLRILADTLTLWFISRRMTHRHDDHRTFSKRHACIIKTGAEN